MKEHDFEQLKNSWNMFGKMEPYWSVLTNDKFKNQYLNQQSLDDFYNSGEYHVQYFEKILNQYGSKLKDKIVFDFGCGVGRITKHVVNIAKKVYGLDISEEHLNIAKKNIPEAEFLLVNNYRKLPTNDIKADVIYSILTLQHNRPILIKLWTALLLQSLAESGIALLHVPYKINQYIAHSDQSQRMEMHFLNQNSMRKIVQSCNCNILSIIDTDYCGHDIFNCIYVIKKNDT